MKFNNTWINHEDDIFVRFVGILNLPKDSYLDILYDLNKKFHTLTYKYGLLMTLSPEYCKHYDVDYMDHYFDFLEKRKNVPDFFPTNGYEFYKKDISRVSKIFFNDQSKTLNSSYLHYIQNGPSGDPLVLLSDRHIRTNLEKHQYFYDASPLAITKPTYVKECANGKKVTVSFSIESHCSFWLDLTPMFRYFDENNRIDFLELSDNRAIAYANTPRLNSFFRAIRRSVQQYGGHCYLYDYKSLLSNNNDNQQAEASERMGLALDNKIVFQEDIEEGGMKFPKIKDCQV